LPGTIFEFGNADELSVAHRVQGDQRACPVWLPSKVKRRTKGRRDRDAGEHGDILLSERRPDDSRLGCGHTRAERGTQTVTLASRGNESAPHRNAAL
jgi:hypothetical protein